MSSRLKSKILTLKSKQIDGLLGCFESDNPNLSYVDCDENELVKQVLNSKIFDKFFISLPLI